MTPEMKQAIMEMMNGDSQPSQGGDYDAICAKVKADLEPMVTMIGQKLEELQKENDELKDIVFKMVTSFSDAVGSHRQQGLRSSISEKFGPDLEAIGGFYKDAYGSDITDDLLEALHDYDGDPMEAVGESIGALRTRFGKYLGGSAPVEAEVSVEKPADDAQGKLDLEPPAEGEKPPESKTEPEKKVDIEPFDQLLADHKQRMGK